MPTDQTIDFVVMFLTIGLVVLGVGSILLGKVLRWWDTLRGVNHSQDDALHMSRESDQTAQTDQTDWQTDQVSVADRWLERVEVDRTRTPLIELMVYSGWQVHEIRAVIKGDNGAIGIEIEAARKRLGIAPQVTPIAGRPTEASFPN